MSKKVWIGAVVVFVVICLFSFLIHGMLLTKEYEATASLWLPMAEMKMWIFYITYAFMAFFFTHIFSKGYEGKGWMEGVRYGTYVAMLVALPSAYGTYGSMAIPYSLALKWFLGGWVQFILCGVALSFVFAKKEASAA